MFARSQPKPATLDLPLLASPSLEAYVSELTLKYPGLTFTHPSLETQQLDASARQAALDEIHDTIDNYQKEHPRTGPVNIFLLDGRSVGGGTSEEAEGPLHALVSQVIADPKHTVVALLPEDESVHRVEDLSPASMLRSLVGTVMSSEGHVLFGREALESFLQEAEYNQRLPETYTVSNESFVGLAALAAIVGFVGWGIWSNRKEKKEREAIKEQVRKLAYAVEHSYVNDTWLSEQTFVGGDVDGAGITPYLIMGNKVPPNLPDEVEKLAKGIKEFGPKYLQEGEKYIETLEEANAEFEKNRPNTVNHVTKFARWSDEDLAARCVAKLWQQVGHLKPLPEVVPFPHPTLGGFAIVPDNVGYKGKFKDLKIDDSKVKALDKNGFKKMAKAVADLLYAIDVLEDMQAELVKLVDRSDGMDIMLSAEMEQLLEEDALKHMGTIEDISSSSEFKSNNIRPVEDAIKGVGQMIQALGRLMERSLSTPSS